MQRAYPVLRRSFASIKDTKAYKATKEFLRLHETYVMPTRYAPAGSTTEGYRYPAPGSRETAVVPTTEDTARYFKNDLIQHDTREMGRDIHVILSEEMKSLPRDVQEEYVTLYSLKGDNAKLFEHPNVPTKPGDLDLWTTETKDVVNDKLFEYWPEQIPHPFWELDAGKIVEDYEAKGLPPCPGKMYEWECPKEMESGLW
ncbi:hypothetical protein WA577_004594 [Blastocystis sp. JDR]